MLKIININIFNNIHFITNIFIYIYLHLDVLYIKILLLTC